MEAITEGVKDALRVSVIAILPVILAGINSSTGTFNIDWKVVMATLVVAIIKGIDKWVHVNPNMKANGLLPF